MTFDPSFSSLALAFVGGGNMARCLVAGALSAGVPAKSIIVGDPSPEQRKRLADEFDIRCTADNAAAVADADLVVMAVKPQAARVASEAIADALKDEATVISIMAGIRIAHLRRWLGPRPSIVRAMPNTPALIGMGVTVLCATEGPTESARERASALLATAGQIIWIDDEASLDAVTAVSGSGPAYAFLVLEALAAAGTDAGLDPVLARQLAVHTVRGAAEMALASGDDPAELRRQVTSPGGTTAAALAVFEDAGLRAIFASAVLAATERGRSLADEFGRA